MNKLTSDPIKLAAAHGHDFEGPGPVFNDGAILGNGAMGAVVTTRPDAICIHLGHNAVWDVRVDEYDPAEVGTFKQVFEMALDSVEPGSKFDNYTEKLQANYTKPYPRPHPCGTLILGLKYTETEVLGYKLDISTGVCRSKLKTADGIGTVEIFVDQSTDLLWVRFLDEDGEPAPAPLTRVRLMPDPEGMGDENAEKNTVHQSEHENCDPTSEPIDDRVRFPTKMAENTLSFSYVLPGNPDGTLGSRRDAAFRVTVASNESLNPGKRINWFGLEEDFKTLEVETAKNQPTIFCLRLEHGPVDAIDDKCGVIATPTTTDWNKAFDTSSANWVEYWSCSSITLDDKELEGAWYLNMYFLHCCIRAGQVCPGLWGPWSYRDLGSAWHGDCHMNYNTQQVFWGVFAANRVEQHIPYVELVERTHAAAKRWADEYFEMRGACFPHAIFPMDMDFVGYVTPPWGWQICEVPWTVQSLWWHYQYTMDQSYLRDRAWEPIRDATLFLVDYISRPEARGDVWDDDRWHIYPTIPPEVYGIRSDGLFNHDCLVDLSLTRFVLRAYLQAADVLGIQDADLRIQVQDVLDHLPDYKIGEFENGPVMLSVPKEDPSIVFNVPIPAMTVFPGEEHGLHSDPQTLELLRNTHRHQQLEGGNEVVFQNYQAARLGTLDLERFKRQLAYCRVKNGSITNKVLRAHGRYDDTTAFDFMEHMGIWVENFATAGVVTECLMQSYNGVIRLFPNWPIEKAAAFSTLRAVGAFLVSASCANGKVTKVRIESTKGGECRIIVPWESGATCRIGDIVTMLAAGTQSIATQEGGVFELTPLA